MCRKIFLAILAVFFVCGGLIFFKSNIKNKIYQRMDAKYEELAKRVDELNQRNLEKEYGANKLQDLVSMLKTYDVCNGDKKVPLIRLGREGDGGYLVAEDAIAKADALLGYGVQDDMSFEEEFSNLYNKHSYGFDCGTKEIKIQNKLAHFVPECIATDSFLYNSTSSMKVSSFKQQIHNLDLENKKLFIKMDIEGAEFEALAEILQNSQNITGIVMELHLVEEVSDSFYKAINLLSALNQNFYLVNLHGNNCAWETFSAKNLKGRMPRLIELSFINKNLVDKAKLTESQIHPSKMDLPTCKHKPEIVFEIKG